MSETDEAAPRIVHDLLERAKALDAELAGAGFRPAARNPTPQSERLETLRSNPLSLFDALVTDTDLATATRSLFRDGHYARAVEEAYKFLCNSVKGKSGDGTRDGQDLMMHVFDADAPVLRLSPLRSMSQRDEQKGYRFLFAGAMTGIRNPRAHEHALRDDADVAMELLVMANHLARVLRRSARVRRKRAARNP